MQWHSDPELCVSHTEFSWMEQMMPMFITAVVCLIVAWPVVAQSQPFEKITIKPAQSVGQSNMRLQVLSDGDLIANAVPVVTLLSYAYDLPINPSHLVSPLPDWAISDRYDIEAKASANAVPPGFPERESRSRMQQMIRRLLADRFGLMMRVEKKKMAVYALTVARGGLKLQKSDTEKDCILDSAPQGCHSFVPGFGHPLNANAIDMDDLAHYIENWTDLPVVNRTQLKGLFRVDTEGWLPMRLPPPPPN
jgi:uncharacterized protein (TIGR03435 family)